VAVAEDVAAEEEAVEADAGAVAADAENEPRNGRNVDNRIEKKK